MTARDSDHIPAQNVGDRRYRALMLKAMGDMCRATRLAIMDADDLPKLFEMCRCAMCLQGVCVVVDLVEEHMVRVAVLEQDVELPTTWLLYARCCVLQNRGFEFLIFGRHDVEFDCIDVGHWRRH